MLESLTPYFPYLKPVFLLFCLGVWILDLRSPDKDDRRMAYTMPLIILAVVVGLVVTNDWLGIDTAFLKNPVYFIAFVVAASICWAVFDVAKNYILDRQRKS